MTISEIRDSFIVDYKFESQKRGTREIEIGNKQIAMWLSEAQQDISNRIKPIKTYQDISVVTSTTDYALNSNFGEAIRAEIAGEIIDIITLNDITTTGTLATGSVSECAIFWDSANSQYVVKVNPPAGSAVTLRLWYYIDTGFYSPSGSAAQDWGTFDGASFTGNLKIPDKYFMALKYFLMSKPFDDFIAKYEAEIRRLNGSVADSMNESFSYSLGL